MTAGFTCFYSKQGDLSVADGVVIQPKTGVMLQVGSGEFFTAPPRPDAGPSFSQVESPPAASFVGGSGRNLILTGLTPGPEVPAGHFLPTIPDRWQLGRFTLTVTGASDATISDGTDVVAILSTGGTAPVGDYASTSYGEDTYNSAASFVLAAAAEEGAPGSIPDVQVDISGGTAQGGTYVATDAALYVSAIDPDWTLVLDPSGSAELRYQGTAMATRAAGLGHDPAGAFESTDSGRYFNPVVPDEAGDGTAETNPFGSLSLVYSWPATPDLDTTTQFLDDEVGYPLDDTESNAVYMSFSGDDTGPSGSETVVINLAAAWDDGLISGVADIACHADWYPSAGGFGPATLDISYTVGGLTMTLPIFPGSTSPASTLVAMLRISEDGTVTVPDGPWTAHVTVIGRLPRPGYVYLLVTEVAGVLDSVSDPLFAEELPAPSGETHVFPLAQCDGASIHQIHDGALVWDRTPAVAVTTGLAWVSLTQDEYDELDPPDADTIYDITDADWLP